MEVTRILQKKIRDGERKFTLNEAVIFSGLAIDEVRSALERIVELYDCRLQVTEKGDLIYDFGQKLHRRNAKSFKDFWLAFLSVSWKSFTFIFKIWITVTLLVYFVIFVILLIALILASQSQQRGSSKRGPQLGQLIYIFFSIFRWDTNSGTILHEKDRRGYSCRKYKPRESVLKIDKKNFIASVYDFVFGPKRIENDTLHDQREIAAFLQHKNGIIVHSEIEALTGRNVSSSENLFTDLLIRFDGDVNVSDKGTIYGRFENMLRGTGEIDQEEVIYYWNEYEAEYELTGNSGSRNSIISLMNGVNLFVSYLILSGSLAMSIAASDSVALLHFVLTEPLLFGWIPFIFSLLFFIIPIVRWIVIRRLNRQRHHNNIRKRLFKVIYQKQGRAFTLADYEKSLNTGGSEEILKKPVIKETLDTLVLELHGEIKVDDAAKMVYHFPRVRDELEEVPYIRAGFKPDTDLGRVVLDSH
jgi:hypothetical protein